RRGRPDRAPSRGGPRSPRRRRRRRGSPWWLPRPSRSRGRARRMRGRSGGQPRRSRGTSLLLGASERLVELVEVFGLEAIVVGGGDGALQHLLGGLEGV